MSRYPAAAPRGCVSGPLFGRGWDRAELGGYAMPGRARVTGGGVKLKKDPKKKAGADGTRPTYHGLDPQPFKLEVITWTPEQEDVLDGICAQILPRAGVKIDPVVLVHPAVFHLGDVVSVVVEGATVREHAHEYGVSGRKMTFELHHWMPPTGKGNKATATPVRAPRNKRAEDAAKRNPPNPLPSKQAGIAGPAVVTG